MPTATDFDLAARRLREVQADLGVLTVPTALLAGSVSLGGRLTASIDTLVDDDAAAASAAAAEADRLAITCEVRAEMCRSFEADLAQHRVDMQRWESSHAAWRRRSAAWMRGDVDTSPGVEPRRPSRPQPPESWIEID
jgi:hypothetical protein